MFNRFKGEALRAKAMRGGGLTIANMFASNLLRLAGNLVLTRLLFPEAFGLMALVQTFIAGMKMLSDTGVSPSIIRSERGDDPIFLNTAWTVQICRGLLLWVLACILAWPLSAFYEEPILMWMMPVAGLSVLISSFTPTKVATAKRHLALGRLTVINVTTNAIGLVVTIAFAWWLQSVWALVVGGIVSSLISVLAQHWFLPGIRNRLLWNRDAFLELFDFGKFILLSSVLGFIMNKGDKLVLGKYLTMADFGVYNIGAMLAGLPLMFSVALIKGVVFPICRVRPVSESAANRRKVFRARRLVVAGALSITSVLALSGVPLIDLLYDPRYAAAGPIVVLSCLALVPQIIMRSYSAIFLSAGDSKSVFRLTLIGAILQITLLILAVQYVGVFGAILVPGLVAMLVSPFRVRFLRQHKGWDPVGDMLLSSFGFGVSGLACWMYWDDLAQLFG